MNTIKKYFKKEFRMNMFYLEHDSVSDFYLSSCQRNTSAVLLLCIRTFVYIGCIGILLASTIMTGNSMSFAFWPIFLTHWGLVFITVTSGFASFVSLRVYFGDPIDGKTTLPWYIKIYWVLYNMTVPLAFFISFFYWTMLTQTEDEFAINPILDVFIHGVNGILMLVLLVFSRHPSRLLHVIYPLMPTIAYLAFSIVYYYTGGTNPFGEIYIYPMLDWSNPGEATVTVVSSAILLIVIHLIVVLISLGRNRLTKLYCTNPHSLNIQSNVY